MGATGWADLRVSLDGNTLDWVEREAARNKVSPSAFVRGCIWHCRRLGYIPGESKLTGREQRRLFDRDPALNGGQSRG